MFPHKRWNYFSQPSEQQEFYHFVHNLSPFVNELIKHKPREVDAMHESKLGASQIMVASI